MDGKISAGKLRLGVSKIQESNQKAQELLESNLIILSLNPNSEVFADLIDELYWILEEITLDSFLSLDELQSLIEENQYEKAEKKRELEVYNSVKEIYLNMQPYLGN